MSGAVVPECFSTITLVGSRYRTVSVMRGLSSPLLGDSVFCPVPILGLAILDARLDCKLTYEAYVGGGVSPMDIRISQRMASGLKMVRGAFSDNSVLLCGYYAFILLVLEYSSSVWESAAYCYCLLNHKVFQISLCL